VGLSPGTERAASLAVGAALERPIGASIAEMLVLPDRREGAGTVPFDRWCTFGAFELRAIGLGAVPFLAEVHSVGGFLAAGEAGQAEAVAEGSAEAAFSLRCPLSCCSIGELRREGRSPRLAEGLEDILWVATARGETCASLRVCWRAGAMLLWMGETVRGFSVEMARWTLLDRARIGGRVRSTLEADDFRDASAAARRCTLSMGRGLTFGETGFFAAAKARPGRGRTGGLAAGTDAEEALERPPLDTRAGRCGVSSHALRRRPVGAAADDAVPQALTNCSSSSSSATSWGQSRKTRSDTLQPPMDQRCRPPEEDARPILRRAGCWKRLPTADLYFSVRFESLFDTAPVKADSNPPPSIALPTAPRSLLLWTMRSERYSPHAFRSEAPISLLPRSSPLVCRHASYATPRSHDARSLWIRWQARNSWNRISALPKRRPMRL
jgi:hypothetical protein